MAKQKKASAGRPKGPVSNRKVNVTIRLAPVLLDRVEKILRNDKPFSYKRNHFIEDAVRREVEREERSKLK